MASVRHFPSRRSNPKMIRSYATDEDFERLFRTEITDLFRLSLHLTADAEKAERGLILAARDCFGRGNIARGFERIWARRAVIRNSIRLVMGIADSAACDQECEFPWRPCKYLGERLPESEAILALPDFDRLAFVICVLERLLLQDCALLMKKSPKDVKDAIVRAKNGTARSALLRPAFQACLLTS